MSSDWKYIQDLAVAGCALISLLACFLVFWTSFAVQGYYLRIRNVFIAFQQIAHALISIALFLGFLNDQVIKKDEYVYRVAGVLMQTGLSSSIFWFLFLSFYYFLRYYLKFYYISRYIMAILVFSLVIPLTGFVFHEYFRFHHDYSSDSMDSFKNFEEFLWKNYDFIFKVFSSVAGFTLVFQVATYSILLAHYNKKFSSTFKKRLVLFDFLIYLPVFGCFCAVVLIEFIDDHRGYTDIVKQANMLLLSLLGLLRLLFSECLTYFIKHIRNSKQKNNDLESSLLSK